MDIWVNGRVEGFIILFFSKVDLGQNSIAIIVMEILDEESR